MKITAEKTTNQFGETRYHFVVISQDVGALSGHRGWSRSVNTWMSKRAAIAAGRREFPQRKGR